MIVQIHLHGNAPELIPITTVNVKMTYQKKKSHTHFECEDDESKK